ncbi:hypothetical protein ABEV34_01365 [Methylorubrum rhodesianum]|uniref:hypothetical protein n=1 Tax=Methylorubrum TaxID=2282523 RepID=UPI0018E37C40|nr:hypothetical protein [Methylorubrum sp. DB1722]
MAADLTEFRRQIAQKREDAVARIMQVPIAALVWGPNPASKDPVSVARVGLRDALRARGHLADFSEELYDSASDLSNFAQQLAQAEAYDVIFSIPSSYGAIAEIHDFARLPSVSGKVIAFIDESHMNGYSHQSLLAATSSASCRVHTYDGIKLPDCIVGHALSETRRLQELFYLAGRRG